ncbi:MAG TPA: hypothetical protein VMY42_27240 [Thermoguttaceae bacterium]|nr:hypothetical protein [Thermoguttaceae bacterium]
MVRILEEAVQVGADSLELEWEDRDLVVYQYFGHTGIGAVAIPEELREAVLREIVKRAKLTRQPTGTMVLPLLGKEYEVFVKQYDSFGESEYTLRLNKARKKSK